MSDSDWLAAFNLVEAVWWLAIAAALLTKRLTVTGLTRRNRLILATAFGLFGISDLIEIWTGAWWKPLGLLLLKAVALLTIVACGFRTWTNRPRNESRNEPQLPDL